MADNRSFAALEWVTGEISETLRQARQSLEAFVDNPKDSTQMRFCLNHIHQVHGTLQLVEFHGAALLAEEMENLAQAMLNRQVRSEPEAQEVLMRSLLQLPVYLDQVKSARNDHPAVVLPLLNDLRAVRGESLLSESTLFAPDLSAAQVLRGKPIELDDTSVRALAQKLRQMYQFAAVGVIKDNDIDKNLEYLDKAFQRLYKLSEGTPRLALWDIGLALVEGLRNDTIEASVSIKNLLRDLDKDIKLIVERGRDGLAEPPSEELLKNLLYYVARSTADSQHIQRIRKRYKLADAMPSASASQDDFAAISDPDAVRSVVDSLQEELNTIKEALDNCLSEQGEPIQALEESLPVFKRIADTLAVLGIGDLRKTMIDQGDAVARLVDNGGAPDGDALMGIAARMIEVENALTNLAAGDGHRRGDSQNIAIDQAQETVINEARNGLEQAKDAIIEYIASQWDRDHLINVPTQLRAIRGGLEMVPLPRAARILGSCARYIEDQLLTLDTQPEWAALDTLADAITSVEYYLERLAGDREEEDEMLLTVAEDSIDSLGYGVATPTQGRERAPATPESVLGKIADVEEVEITAPQPQSESDDDSAMMDFDVTWEAAEDEEKADAQAEAVDPSAAPESKSEPEPEAESEQAPQPTAEDEVEDIAASPAAESAPATAETADDDDEDFDEEIVEIFIEEAGEVLEAIHEFFPQWAQDFDNQEALTEFRRAFHTLKGSGRMVKAELISELAWSVENMLNRVLDESVDPHRAHVNLIQRVVDILPPKIEAFKNHQPDPFPEETVQLQAEADQLAKGEIPVDKVPDKPDLRVPAGMAPPGQRMEPEAELEEEEEEGDSVLWEIFGSEAQTHLEVVEKFVADMDANAPLYSPPSDAMQRALHTLKGSAHMAEITPIATLATPLEHFVKELRNYQVNIDDDILQLIKDGVAYIHEALAQIAAGDEVHIGKLDQFLARVAELRERHVGPLLRASEAQQQEHKVDPQLLAIFMAEEMRLLLDADEILAQWRHSNGQPHQMQELLEELKTLQKGAAHAGQAPMAELSALLHDAEANAVAHDWCDDSVLGTLLEGHNTLLDMVDAVAAGQNIRPAPSAVADALGALRNRAELADSDGTLPTAEVDEGTPSEDQAFSVDWETEMAAFDAEQAPEDDATVDSDEPVWQSFDDVIAAETTAADDAPSTQTEEPSAQAEEPSAQAEQPSAQTEEPSAQTEEPSAQDDAPAAQPQEPPAEPPTTSDDIAAADDSADAPPEGIEVDSELLEIFIDEADELLELIDEAIHQWTNEPQDKEPVEELKRALHTLKGGARLAGLMGLGELTHNFETYLIQHQSQGGAVDDVFFNKVLAFHDKLISGVDVVKHKAEGYTPEGMEEVLQSSGLSPEVQPLDQAPTEAPGEAATPTADGDAASGAEILPFARKSEGAEGQMPSAPTSLPQPGQQPAPQPGQQPAQPGAGQQPAGRRGGGGPQEVVKVSADLLEELVNLAGETSISRGRVEEMITDFGFALDELDSTIGRMQEQVRRLDIETEAQILYRQEQILESGYGEDFDPLEMDRYSLLQQLSRSLLESTSDLLDLKDTLSNKTRDTETLLLQQSRINTDLQEGLMRSRMVPFSRLVPRLRRIVRQVSSELGKDVDFHLENVEGELDRSMLERMVAPLEHMLRNAVDHGIESADERRAVGKKAQGAIQLSLAREGSQVVLKLADDGRGINLERVRQKAIERGLMEPNAPLTDHEVMQFIMHAGFSTADQVTQISGRGVGMDVVASEIKQLGGQVTIDSQAGQGTEFTVRLPFTVSVNRALMVEIGEDRYAIPLNTIEGIVRVSPFELEHYYGTDDARFSYAGENYRVQYLGALLHTDNYPKLENQALPLPVILIRSADHSIALQVDRLLGSREIVVKTLGPQFSAVEGLSGATVLGDGSVVVILDLQSMIRADVALLSAANTELLPAEPQEPEEPDEEAHIKTVMVVDDSVTVRKVTGRFLEREGFNVITARDGVDALRVLNETVPDVMLLDIEMPRMDGFEVATSVRSSQRLKELPIIMITSRTGEKHRERALNIGVNNYMGKPYQEETLLAAINELVGRTAAQ